MATSNNHIVEPIAANLVKCTKLEVWCNGSLYFVTPRDMTLYRLRLGFIHFIATRSAVVCMRQVPRLRFGLLSVVTARGLFNILSCVDANASHGRVAQRQESCIIRFPIRKKDVFSCRPLRDWSLVPDGTRPQVGRATRVQNARNSGRIREAALQMKTHLREPVADFELL